MTQHDINEKYPEAASAIRKSCMALTEFFADDPESEGLRGCAIGLGKAAATGLEWRSRVEEAQGQSRRSLAVAEEAQKEGRRSLAVAKEATEQSESYRREVGQLQTVCSDWEKLAKEQAATIADWEKLAKEQAATIAKQNKLIEEQTAQLLDQAPTTDNTRVLN